MSRSSAATTAGRARTIQRTATPPLPRRVSGPAVRPRHGADGAPAALPARRAPRPRRLAYGGVAIASRVAGVALDVSASRAMDRLILSRVWIGIIAFGLIGLVVVQVSLLKLNSGIGRAVTTASTLERSNAALRADVSRLSAGGRIAPLAADKGLVMPAPADVSYLRAGKSPRADAARAVRRMRPPGSLEAALTRAPALAAGIAAPGTIAATTGVPAEPGPAVAPAATGTAVPAAPAAGGPPVAVATAPAAGGTAAPVTTAPAGVPPDGTAAPAGATGSSGGAVPQPAIAAP